MSYVTDWRKCVCVWCFFGRREREKEKNWAFWNYTFNCVLVSVNVLSSRTRTLSRVWDYFCFITANLSWNICNVTQPFSWLLSAQHAEKKRDKRRKFATPTHTSWTHQLKKCRQIYFRIILLHALSTFMS